LVQTKQKGVICSNPTYFMILLPTQRYINSSASVRILECFKWNGALSYKTIIFADRHFATLRSSFIKKIMQKI